MAALDRPGRLGSALVLVLVGTLTTAWTARAADEAGAPSDRTVHGHSQRAVRAALLAPLDPEAQQAALQFDERLQRSGQVGSLAVRLVTGAPLERAQAIVTRLSAASHRRRAIAWTVRVLDSDPPQDNAFVAGGTFIYVYTGLLALAESDDELAFVLSHEMAHGALKHDWREDADVRNRRVEALQSSRAGSAADPQRPGLQLIGNALRAAYSRADEQEADALGAFIAHRAGYDPARAVSYFERQMTAAAAAPRQPAEVQVPASMPQRWARLVSRTSETHPDHHERLVALMAVDDHLDGRRTLASLAKIGQGYKVLVALDALLKR